jgi:hypothetical protein
MFAVSLRSSVMRNFVAAFGLLSSATAAAGHATW